MDKVTHEMRLIQWTQIVRECRDSGISVKSWCIENNISEKQFYYWQRRVRGEVYNALEKTESKSGPNFVQLSAPVDSSRNTSSFMADMVIHVGNNKLELANTVSEELLSKVLRVMADVK